MTRDPPRRLVRCPPVHPARRVRGAGRDRGEAGPRTRHATTWDGRVVHTAITAAAVTGGSRTVARNANQVDRSAPSPERPSQWSAADDCRRAKFPVSLAPGPMCRWRSRDVTRGCSNSTRPGDPLSRRISLRSTCLTRASTSCARLEQAVEGCAQSPRPDGPSCPGGARRLHGRVALITGGARGQGRLARRAARA